MHRAMGVGYRPGGGIVAQNTSLLMLIQFAYANHDAPHWLPLPASQVVGGPSWMGTSAYDIEAKPAAETDPAHSWLMLQSLLAGRFKLALHTETRELPTYDLTVAASGPKLPAAKEAGCVSFPPGTAPHAVPGKVDCGYVSGPISGSTTGQFRIEGRKVHVSDLVRELSSILGRPVLDKTGYTAEFDLRLNFAPSDALMGMPGFGGPGNPGGSRANASLPDIFAALEGQLGLKLVPDKGPVAVLVIDHAERPAAD